MDSGTPMQSRLTEPLAHRPGDAWRRLRLPLARRPSDDDVLLILAMIVAVVAMVLHWSR